MVRLKHICICATLCGFAAHGRAAPNLLPNGGFEDIRPVSAEEWAPHSAVGWVLAGKPQLPVGWRPGAVSGFHLPGTIEAVEHKAQVKEGRRCLRITTQARGNLVRAVAESSFPAPKTGSLAWSYWARGAGGVKRPTTDKVFNQQFYVLLTYPAADGDRTLGLPSYEERGRPVPNTWTHFSGTCSLEGCTGNTVRVTAAAYKRRGYPVPTTIWLDDMRFVECAPPEAAPTEEAGSAQAAGRPRLVARTDYALGRHWKLPVVCGRDFWHIHATHWLRCMEELKNNYPRLWETTLRGAWFDVERLGWDPPQSVPGNAPFLIHGLRWGQGEFLNPWISKYGRKIPRPTVHDPERAIDGIKANQLSGWRSQQGLPQWIELGLEQPAQLSGLRLFPAWGKGRRTKCTVKVSADRTKWTTVATVSAGNRSTGHLMEWPARPVQYVRVDFEEDTLGHVHLVEVELLCDGNVLEVASVTASSTANPVLPERVKTIRQHHCDTLEKYGDRYLGVAVLEWDNDLSYTWIHPQRRARDTQQQEMMRGLGFDMDRAPAKTREEAMGRIQEAFRMMTDVYGGQVAFMTSKSIWEHYTLEFGSTVSFSEISNHSNYDPFRFRMAVGRGAARQYGRPWILYTVNRRHHPPTGSYGDISASLFFRQMVLGYMLNCTFYHQESARWLTRPFKGDPLWGVNYFVPSLLRAERFIEQHPDRGITYTPILLGLDWLHGYGMGAPFGCVRGGRSDLMIRRVTTALMPHRAGKGWAEEGNQALANSTFGDVFDVMVLNPPSDTASLDKLAAYKAVLLLGHVRWSQALEKRMRSYVEIGGTLVLAANQLRAMRNAAWTGITVKGMVEDGLPLHDVALPAGADVVDRDEKGHPLVVKSPVGRGLVVVCTANCMLDKAGKRLLPTARNLLQTLHDQCLPVSVDGDIEFAVNRSATSWIVTLINNRGISKDAIGPTIVDHTKLAKVRVTPRFSVGVVEEWMEREVAEIFRDDAGTIREVIAIVPPGDVRIVEMKCAK